jgi:hypothetical protein
MEVEPARPAPSGRRGSPDRLERGEGADRRRARTACGSRRDPAREECVVEFAGDSPDLRLELTYANEPIVYCAACFEREFGES